MGASRISTLAILSVNILAAQAVATGYGSNGLTSLTYNGNQFLASGAFSVNQVILENNSGNQSNGSVTGTVSVNPSQNQVTMTYSWGSILVTYAPSGSRLNLTITTTNRTSQTIQGLFYNVMNLKFPSKVQEFDGVDPLVDSNIGAPTAISMSSSGGVMVLADDDVTTPLMAGFPWALDAPADTEFPLRVNTNRDPMYPSFWPFINRPIAPGASDTYRFSLRFGPPGSTVQSLAGDIYQSFAAAFPSQINWPDRRPVGMLVMATSAAGWPTNPRGWLSDPTIDVTTPSGLAAFQARILQWADNSIQVLKSANAQGMITWDIEGEQFQQPASYVCDPTQFLSTAPEMASVADAYFQKFRDAGLRVGVCVRPQQFVLAPGGASATQQDVADPTSLLISKIEYAKNRWGASMFYIDSDGGPNNPTDAGVFQRVSAAEPNVLLVPEHKDLQYYAYSAPYRQLNQGAGPSPPEARETYPSAFSLLNVSDAALSTMYQSLVTAVGQGDVLLFRGWFDDGSLSQVKSIYATATGRDNTPPVISISAPAAGSTVSGAITVTASATDNVGVSSVQFSLDGTAFGPTLLTAPYTATLNTASFANGSHTLTAAATDAAGNTGTSGISITISNIVTPPPPPSCPGPATNAYTGCYYSGQNFNSFVFTRTDPAIHFDWSGTGPQGPLALGPDNYSVRWQGNFAFQAGTYQFTINTDDGGILYIDGAAVYSNWTVHGALPVTVNATLTAGTHLVELDYFQNAGGAVAQLSWQLTAASPPTGGGGPAPGPTPPSVAIISPANGAGVSGSIPLLANASSQAGIATVQFQLDGVNLGAALSASPYSMTLDTTTITNGAHNLTAIARDTGGTSATSAAVQINVSNVAISGCATPGTNVFIGCYYSGQNFNNFVFTRTDPVIHFDWSGTGPQGPAPLGPDNYSVRWLGSFAFQAGTYQFTVNTDDGDILYVDGQPIYSNWMVHGSLPVAVNAPMTAGTHVIRLDYFQNQGGAVAQLSWQLMQ